MGKRFVVELGAEERRDKCECTKYAEYGALCSHMLCVLQSEGRNIATSTDA